MSPRNVTQAEFEEHLRSWPRPLERDIFGAFEPPLVTYNDFTFGNWPESVVASTDLEHTTFRIHRGVGGAQQNPEP